MFTPELGGENMRKGRALLYERQIRSLFLSLDLNDISK